MNKYGGFDFDYPQESLEKVRSAVIRAISSRSSHNFWEEFKYVIADYFGLDKKQNNIFCFESRAVLPFLYDELFGYDLIVGWQLCNGKYLIDKHSSTKGKEQTSTTARLSITSPIETETYIPLFGNRCPEIEEGKTFPRIEYNPYLLGGVLNKSEPRIRLSEGKDLYIFSAAIPGYIDSCSGLVVYAPDKYQDELTNLEQKFPMSQLGAAIGTASLTSTLITNKAYLARRRELGQNLVTALENRVDFPDIDFTRYNFPFIPVFTKNKKKIKEKLKRKIDNIFFFDHIYQEAFPDLLLLPIRASWSETDIFHIITTFIDNTELK